MAAGDTTYGYWSMGLGWAQLNGNYIPRWWERKPLISTAHASAQWSGTCTFTAFEDACYPHLAKWARENAWNCDARPSFARGTDFVDGWISTAIPTRTARANECFERERDLIRAVNAARVAGRRDFTPTFDTRNFGESQWDKGYNANPECVGP
jgi:hypothetical protein